MLRFFRFNDPYRLVIVFFAIVLLGIKAEWEFPSITFPELKGVLVGEMMDDGKQLYTQVWDSMPPITAFVQYLLDVLFDRATMPRHLLSCAIFFFQAAFFGILLINNRAFGEIGYLPSLLFSLLCFFSFDTVSLTGEIIGSTLLLLAINNLLKEIEFKKQRDETVHNLGFFLGLATLCSFSYVVFFIGTALLLFLFTRVEIRRFVLFVFGFLLPHGLLMTWYYWNNSLELLWSNFYVANLALSTQDLVSSQSLWILGAVPGVYFLLANLLTRSSGQFTKYQSQIRQIMLLWLVFGLIELYLSRQRTPQALLVCVPPIAYFVSHFLLMIKRKALAETMLWFFIFGIIGVNSLAIRNLIGVNNFSSLLVSEKPSDWKGKKLMVLEDTLDPYITNNPAGYFLEWKLCKQVFEDPGYYQHVLTVADAIEKDPPDVIFDPNNLMSPFLFFLPEVQSRYRREKNMYVRI
jgi:hypothetical protein